MRNYIVVLFFLLFVTVVRAEVKTKLVVGITVNQFYPEWLQIYENDLSEDGFKRFLQQGKQLTGDYNYLYSQTGTDQATIYTGLLPAYHGIVAHDWVERLSAQRQNNTLTTDYAEIDGCDSFKGHSPEQLQALTLGCMLKMNNQFSRVYSISMNPEEAVISGGSCADMALWYSEQTGQWVSSQYYADSLPAWGKAFNAKMESDFFIRRGWMPMNEEQSNSFALKWKNKIGLSNNSFFYDIAQARKKFDTYRVLKATPYANTMVVDLAEEVIGQAGLGKDNDVDLLALNFSCLDYMNRDFGVYAREFQDVVLRLDRDLEKLFSVLDTKVGKGNYTVCLTFSEARELLPEELVRMKVQGGYFSIFKAVALLKSYLNLIYGEGEWVKDYDAGQIYLNREWIEKNNLSLKEVQDRVADFMVEFEGVAEVLTAYSLTHNAFSEGNEKLIQNAFSQKRSGDVMYCLLPTWVSELKDKEDTYFRYSKRNKVPVYFYGAGTERLMRKECQMTDLLPTWCELTGIPVPYTAVGSSVFK